MDHHHRHHPSHHPSHHNHHLQGHSSRYAPFPHQQPPATPVLLAPDPYRRPPHLSFPPPPPPAALPPPPSAAAHHHRPDVVYVSYGPSSSHASDGHGRLLAPVDPSGRLVVKALHPHLPAVRVSERIIFPEGHPEGPRVHHHLRRSSSSCGGGGGGEAFVREDFKRERVRVLDEGQAGPPYGRREGEAAVELAEQEDVARRLGLLGRKRSRLEDGRALGEETLLGCFLQEREPKRLTSGATTSRRRCDVMYDLRAMGVESSRGSAPVFVSERGDTVLSFPRLPAEVPLRSSPVYSSVSKPELLGKSPIMEPETLVSGGSHDFREKNLVGRGKRFIFGGEEEVHALPRKAPQQKPSVLSRIQFAKPVYKRRCEQQIRSTTSPPPVSQTLAFSEGNQFEMDVPVKLDVSFKSDALVAKEILPSPASSLRRSSGEVCGARTTKKNVAKITTVSPSTSFLKSHDKVTAMHSYKLKIREERFAHSYAGGKPNKERIPKKKVTNNILVSSNSTLQNFADEVTGSRTPKNKVVNEVSISPNPVQSYANRVSPVRVTEKKMAEKIVALPHATVQSCDGKITSTRSPKRKPAKGILAPQGNVMPSFSDRITTLETLELPSCDGIIAIERCPEEKPAREIVVNSIDAQMDIGVTANSSESTGKKLVKETLVAQKAVSLHCSEKVTSVNGSKKEVLENISLPSVSVVPTAEENSIIDRPKEKQGKDTFTSLSSVVNSDKRITTLRTLKKKIIKRNKKKKVVAAIDPCLRSMDPSEDCSKEHVLTNSPLKIEPSRMLASTMASSHMEKKYLKEESRDAKDSGIVQKVLASGSSGEDVKELKGVHVKFVSGDHEGMSSTTVRSLKEEAVKRKNTGEFTLFPCGVDSCPVQKIYEMPILNSAYADPNHSKEVQRGSLSKCSQEDTSHSEAHSDALQGEVHQDILEAGEVHGGSVPHSHQKVGHLDHKSSAKATACTDENFQGRGQDQHILMGRHNDVTHPVLLERAETSDVGELGVDNSTLELHLQRIVLPGHLEANTTETPSNALVPMKFDISPKTKSSIENAAEDLKSSVKQEESRGDGNVYLREDSGSGKHPSALEQNFSPDTVCDKEVNDEGMASLDGRNSCKADIKSSDREIGQELSPGPQSSPVLEELEMVSCEKDSCAVLPCHLQCSSLQVEAHTTIPELEKERKQSVAPGFISIETNLGEVDSEKNIVGGERSRELHAKAQDAILDRNLLIETDGLVGGVLQLPFIDAFPQSSPSVIRVDGSAVNSMAKQVAEGVHSSPLDVSEENSPEILATVSEIMHFAEMKQSACDLLDSKNCHGDSIVEKPYGDSNGKTDYLSDSMSLAAVGLKLIDKSDIMKLSDCFISGKTLPAQTQEADKQLIKSHQPTGKEMLTSMKECQGPGISKIYPNQKSLSARTFKKPPSHSIRNNKWYRMENPPVSCSPGQMKWPSRSLPRQSPKKLGKIQSSYIRKGNSLIRKPSPAIPSSHPYPEQTTLDQICLPEANKTMSSEHKINITDHFNFSSAKPLNSSFERPKTPPLPLSNKLMHPSLDNPQTLRDDPLSEPVGVDTAIPSVGTQGFDLKEANHSICLAEESKILGKKKLIYVKHRSNQLIAAPVTDANNTSVRTTEECLALPFAPPDIYYRRKNKLIRDTSLLDGQLKQEMSHSKDCSGATCHGPSKISSLKDGAKVPRKTRLEKAMGKTYKQSRFSLVWRLNGTQSQDNKCSNVSKHQKVLPYLFPWKRSMCWRGFITKMGSNWTKHSPSFISRKLQLSRQRDTIYTISNSGFSLRKSGVLSAGGSNLKWSKSMERRSRKASEEATLAVVEHERKKKKHKGTTCADLAPKSENCSQRERVFRVGTIHYKMDSSRRTLVRIPDEQTAVAANSQTVAGAKISIVPRRLVIGNDEYIRVGNGNQLIRDPKKLVRILANEKIRWSLHTARLRSVRKQQYCQFFTRFGKCNKEDGKCPFIHDPTKIAICTKFLKGLCSGPNCKLTHKVIPERMPDCSYFLKGLCTNISCPYRHVNVNSKAPVCEGFLKGYCRDGDKCRKKHSHVCPFFEASGECHHGSMCKLHHPKRANKQANKSRKRKRSPIHDHGRGRYFGCSVAEVGESQAFASNMDIQKKDEDIFFHEGRFTEYISLDVDSDDAVGFNDLIDSHPILMDFDLSDSQLSDADALIKPVRIMKMALR